MGKAAAKSTAGTPARGYSWEQFKEGNVAAVRHGAYSPALIEPRAKELAAATYDAHPHLHPVRDQPAVVRYATVLARLERLYLWIGDHPEMFENLLASPQGPGPHGAWDRCERWERAAERAEQTLALSPLSRARLGIDHQVAQLTEEEIAERQAARERLDQRIKDLDAPKENT